MSQPALPARRLSLGTILAFAAGGLSLSGLNIAIPISLQPYFAQTLGVGLVPIALAGFTFLEIGAAAATPMWVTLVIFSLNHFVELHAHDADEPRPA